MTDVWDPALYARFEAERARPFDDLLTLLAPCNGPLVVDLGCGTGALTARLHRALGARATLGLDSSPAMLARAAEHAGGGVSFQAADLGALPPLGGFDVVFSNAALHWVDDHPALLARLVPLLAPGGQLAIQVPANHEHVSHRVAAGVAAEEPFAEALDGWVRRSPVLAPEAYALRLHALGLSDPQVRAQVYLHLLPDRGAVVDWMAGTTLTAYARRLPAALYERFLARYAERLVAELPDERPFPFPFTRILMHAVRPA